MAEAMMAGLSDPVVDPLSSAGPPGVTNDPPIVGAPGRTQITARMANGSGAVVTMDYPPRAEDIGRLARLASEPGLAEAEWTCREWQPRPPR